MLNRNEPIKVERTFWVTGSSLRSFVARGVTLFAAEP